MTPKEKAKELIDKYYPLVEIDSEWSMINNARALALICVNEITTVDDHIYWLEVKEELEKEIPL